MAGSSADGDGEPIVGKRPLPESWACAATLAQDEETAAWVASQTKRRRQDIKGKIHMEGKAMTREDQLANVRRRAENSEARATKLQKIIQDLKAQVQAAQAAQRPAAGACSEPRFSAGQSVLQWWASWFKEESPKPKQCNKKQRPTWFSGEILNPAVWTEGALYAGVRCVGWVHPTR